MPQNKDNPNIERLKAISMFDPSKDFSNDEAKEHLSVLFRELIMSGDDTARQFFKRFKSGIDKIIKDMGIVSDTASDMSSDEDEVDMSPTPQEDGLDGNTDLEMGGNVDQKSQGIKAAAVPEDMLKDSVNYLVGSANRFLYL